MFNNMSIAKRLAAGFAMVLALLIVVTIMGYWGSDSVARETATMLHTTENVAEHASRARANIVGLRRYEKDYFLNIGAKAKEAEYLSEWNKEREHLLARLADLDKYATLDQDKKDISTMKEEFTKYEVGFHLVQAQIDAGQSARSRPRSTRYANRCQGFAGQSEGDADPDGITVPESEAGRYGWRCRAQ
jgi:methyl-accepting chemotaxis protein